MPAVAMIAISLAATAYSMYATNKSGKMQQKAFLAQGAAAKEAGVREARVYDEEAKLSEYNAAVAELQAQDALARGEWSADRMAEEIDQVVGSQRAGMAAGNIDVGFGSAVDINADAAALGALDIAQIRNNAAAEAWGFQVESTDLRKRADIYRLGGENAKRLGELGLQTATVQGQNARSLATTQMWGTALNTGSSLLVSRYGSQWTKSGGGW